MSQEQQQQGQESEDQRIPGLRFSNCTFNNVTITGNSIYMDSYGYRTIGDITRLQELRFQQTTTQQPSLPADSSASAPSTSIQVPLGNQTPSSRKNPTRTRKKKELAQYDILPTPQDTPEAPVESSSKEKERDPYYS